MESSVPNVSGFDIASIVGRLSTATPHQSSGEFNELPSKALTDPSLTNLLNQHIKSIIEHYTASSLANPMILQKSTCAKTIIPEQSQTMSVDIIKAEPFIDVQNNTPPPVVTGEDELGEAMKSRGTRQIHCSECPRILLSRKNFIKHAEDEHGLILPIIYKNFENQQEFDKWIAYLREERNTEFVSKCGRKRLSNGSLLGYLVCAKSGSEAWKSKKKTAKSLKTCSAYLKVLRNETTGRIEIEGCLDHTGHELPLADGKSDQSNGWLAEGASFSEVCAQIESRRVGESSYLNFHPVSEPAPRLKDSNIQVDVLNTKPLDISTPDASACDTMLNFLNILRQKDADSNIKQIKQAVMDTTHNAEVLSKSIQCSPDAIIKTLACAYVNVDLERRKLAMLEQFQITIKRIDERSIDGAEIALKFFIREVESLNKS